MTDSDSITNISRSSGADLNAQGDIDIREDVVGRGKITHTNMYETLAVGVGWPPSTPAPAD